MFPFLLLAFLLVPLAEIWVFAQVGNSFGFGITFLAIIAVSVIGAWLVKREGIGAWRRGQERLARGESPTGELVNGVLILAAGALMLTPGFLTDAFGLSLLFPPTRAVYRAAIMSRFAAGAFVVGTVSNIGGSAFGFGRRNAADEGEDDIWDVEGWEEPPDRPSLP